GDELSLRWPGLGASLQRRCWWAATNPYRSPTLAVGECLPKRAQIDSELAMSKGRRRSDLSVSLFPSGTLLCIHKSSMQQACIPRYVASGPHCWAMWIGLTGSGTAGGTDHAVVTRRKRATQTVDRKVARVSHPGDTGRR